MFLPSSLGVSPSVRPADPVDESLWYPEVPASAVPNSEPTTVGVNLGTLFTTTISGDIGSICYYRVDAGMATSGTVALWQISSSLPDVMLSTADFTGHGGTGWQVIELPEPIPVTSANAYMASIWFPSSGTSVIEATTPSYFTNSGRFSEPWGMLEAPPSNGQFDSRGFIRRNGFITVGTFARPTGNWNGGCYWVDVIMTGRPVPEPPYPPMVLKWDIPEGWPTEATTGHDPATVFEPDDITTVFTSADDEIIENRNMFAGLVVRHSGVTVRNCFIRARGFIVAINPVHDEDGTTIVSNILIEDCTMDGYGRRNPGATGIVFGGVDVTVQRCNIYRVGDGTTSFGHAYPSNIIFRDNFIHHLHSSPGTPHYDGMQFDGGNINVTVDHNTIFNENSDTSTVSFNSYGGPCDNMTMSNNCLFGAGYTVLLLEVTNPGADTIPMTNVYVFNNQLQIGHWGYWQVNITPNRWDGNQYLTHGGLFDAQPEDGFADGQSVPEGLQVYGLGGGSTVHETIDAETGGLTLGTSFTVTVDGVISSINFYRPTGSPNLTIALWKFIGGDLSGGTTLLASRVFTDVTRTGTVNLAFLTPVPVSAGDNLLVGVFLPRGNDGTVWYSVTNSFFGPANHASQFGRMFAFNSVGTPFNGFTGDNGLFQYGPGLTPPLNASGLNGYYYVDPILVAPWVAEAPSDDVTVSVNAPAMTITAGNPVVVANSVVTTTVSLASPAMAAEQGGVTATGFSSTNASVDVTSLLPLALGQGDVTVTAKRSITTQIVSPPIVIARGTVTAVTKRSVTVGVTSLPLVLAQGNETVVTPSDLVVGDATNTGVPAGSTLVNSGEIFSSANGQIIELKNCNNSININHNNVIVRKCRVTVGANDMAIRMADTVSGVIVEDCDIIGSHAYMGIHGGGIIRRCNIHGFSNGIDVTLAVTKILNNWIWGLPSDPGAHDDTLQIDGGCTDLEVGYNTLENLGDETSCVMLDTYWDSHANCDIHHNVMKGGGSYTVYCTAFDGKTITNTRFRFNQMDPANFGYFNIENCTPTLTGNTDRLSGAPITG